MSREFFKGWTEKELMAAFQHVSNELAALEKRQEELRLRRNILYVHRRTGKAL